MSTGNRAIGILSAVASSATFGLAPFFTLGLLAAGLSPFEALSYRWGVAALFLTAAGAAAGRSFRLSGKDLGVVAGLSILRAATSFCLVLAYANIASGAASTIHFMYPLAVAAAMMLFFHEKPSLRTIAAIAVSIAGAALLSTGGTATGSGDTTLGTTAAALSVLTYGGYMIGVKNTRAANIDSTALTCYVMAFGALFFLAGGWLTGGVRWVNDGPTWFYILGLALPATAVSNITLIWAIKRIGPTLTSFFGALEPLTAVIIGVRVFGEPFTLRSGLGIVLIVAAVSLVVGKRSGSRKDRPSPDNTPIQ